MLPLCTPPSSQRQEDSTSDPQPEVALLTRTGALRCTRRGRRTAKALSTALPISSGQPAASLAATVGRSNLLHAAITSSDLNGNECPNDSRGSGTKIRGGDCSGIEIGIQVGGSEKCDGASRSSGIVKKVLGELAAVRSEQAALTAAFLAVTAAYRHLLPFARGADPSTDNALAKRKGQPSWSAESGFLTPMPMPMPAALLAAATLQQPNYTTVVKDPCSINIASHIYECDQGKTHIAPGSGKSSSGVSNSIFGQIPVVASSGLPQLHLSAMKSECLDAEAGAQNVNAPLNLLSREPAPPALQTVPASQSNTMTGECLQGQVQYTSNAAQTVAIDSSARSAYSPSRSSRSVLLNSTSGEVWSGRRPARVLWVEALRRSHAASAAAAAAAAATAEAAAASTANDAGADFAKGSEKQDEAPAEHSEGSSYLDAYSDLAANGFARASALECQVS